MPRTTTVTLMRKRVLGPGSTEHNGRGVYEMDHHLSQEEFWANMFKFLEKHKDSIERVVIEDDDEGEKHFLVRLNKEFGSRSLTLSDGSLYDGGSYRTICVPMRRDGQIGILC